jgi:hypothetical protein
VTGLPLTGGCLCGGVRFEIGEPPVSSGYCHCTRCQRRTGAAASPQARIAPGSMRLLSGEDLIRGWQPPDHGWGKFFCSNCGSQLWSESPDGAIRSVRLGAFDGDPGIRPTDRQWLSSAAPWEPVPDDGLEHHEGPRR